MARLRDRHLGTVQGQVGDQVFKVLNGESYVAQLPHRSNTEPTEAVKNHRKRFGLTMKFMKAIYAILILRLLWKEFTPEGVTKAIPASAKIVSASYPSVTPAEILDTATLVPDFGFAVTTTNVTVDNTSVNVAIDPLGDTGIIDTNIEKYIQLACVIHLSEPTITTALQNRFFSLVSEPVLLNTANPLSFDIGLDSAQGQVFDAYQTKKAFFVMVTTAVNEVPVHFSSTFHLTV